MSDQPIRLQYSGTGFGIFWRTILGTLLTIITLGLYVPWFMNSLTRYVCKHVQVIDPAGGTQPTIEFTGSGWGLLARLIFWYILTYITLGLFGPWALNGMYRYTVRNIVIRNH